jgi:LDH2 family malate/lactate/ureidoglycolate dehydrogenase
MSVGSRGSNLVFEDRRHPLDDLRRFASALASRLEVPPARASDLASHFLWFDEAGFPAHGLAQLPELLDRIASGLIDPREQGAAGRERNGTAIFDARRGIPLLALERAGQIAIEKSRDAGVGLVAVQNLELTSPATGIAAELAVGPTSALIVGPGPSCSLALPSAAGLPAIYDPALDAESADDRGVALVPLLSLLVPEGGWLILAASVLAFEPLTSIHGRVAQAFANLAEGSGHLLPQAWESRRREARERGVAVAPEGWTRLVHWAERLGVAIPESASE